MKKLLFFAESVSLAHIGRPLVLANWAKDKGYQVHIATGEKGLELLKTSKSEINYSEVYTIPGETFYKRVNQGKFFYTTAELEKYIAAEVETIKTIEPDYIISDFRLTTAISARVANIPLINLSNAYWSPHYECRFLAPNTGIFACLPENLKNHLFDFIRPIAFKTFGKKLNAIRKKYNLTSVNDFRTHYTAGDYTLYLDHPDFIKLKNPPFRHTFLGPVIWSPSHSEKTNHQQRCIYITMGSSGNNQVLAQIAKACLPFNRQIIISGLRPAEAEKLLIAVPGLQTNSIIKPLVNAEEVLRNCDLTICHGGSGTVYQSLKANTPVLCFPHNPDQGLVAMAVKESNWGAIVSPSQSQEKIITPIIQKILNDKEIAKSVSDFSKKLISHQTQDQWLAFLNNLETTQHQTQILEGSK